MISYSRAVYEVARKEALQHLRTKRLLVMGILLLASLLFATLVVPKVWLEPFFEDEPGSDEPPLQHFAFLLFLNLPLIGGFLILQMLALILTADGVSSEWQRRTIFLLLSKPVPRTAFVLGKFLGSAVPLMALFGLVFLADYIVLAFALEGSVDGSDVASFLGALALLLLGTAAFCALGLFFSTLARSSTPSFTMSLLAALLVFPLVGMVGTFISIGDQQDYYDSAEYDACIERSSDFDGCEFDLDAAKYDWWRYLTPGAAMNRASPVLVGGEEGAIALSGFIPQYPPARTGVAVLAGIAWTGLLVGGSLLMVRARDFD